MYGAIGFLREERASFALETALVIPVILFVLLAVLVLCLYFYSQASLYALASVTAERTAYSWDNSGRNVKTGAFTSYTWDGLYWRLFDDNVFGLDDALPEKKKLRTLAALPQEVDADIRYTNQLFKRQVNVRLNSLFQPGQWFPLARGNASVSAQAQSGVTEPAEFIRTVNWFRTYLPYLKNQLPGGWRSVLEQFGNANAGQDGEAFRGFDREIDARRYLQKLVKGKETDVPLPGGKRRKIDALDKDNVAHQAYIGYVSNRNVVIPGLGKIDEQLYKDIQLLENGTVKGVVWHFFRKNRADKFGPSKPLLRELERRGIIVEIHE